MRYVDSALATTNLSPADRYQFYSFRLDVHHCYLRNQDAALRYADSILMLFESGRLERRADWLFRAYMLKANTAYAAERYEQAFAYYAQARQIATESGAPCEVFRYLYQMAMAQYREENYLAAARLFRESFDMSVHCVDRNGDTRYRQQEILSNTGLAYGKACMPDSSIPYFYSALDFIRQHADTETSLRWDEARSVIYGNIASEYKDRGRFDSAHRYFAMSIDLSRQTGRNVRDRQFNLLKLADMRLQQNRPQDAWMLLQQYDSIGADARMRWTGEELCEQDLRRAAVYARYYEVAGELDDALRMSRMRDTLLHAKQQRMGRMLKNDLESGVKRKSYERSIVSLSKDVRIRQQANIILVLSLVLAIMVVVVIYRFLTKNRRQYKKLERDSAETQAGLHDTIRSNQLNFLALIENTNDFLWSVDGGYKLLAFNRAYRDHYSWLTGSTPVVGTAEPVANFAPDFYDTLREGYASALAGQRFEVVAKGLALNNAAPDIKIRFRPIRNQQDVVVGVSCFQSDITEYLQLIARLEENNKRLKDIAWVQSHKLRGPLTTIMSIVNYLDEEEHDEQLRKNILMSLHEKINEMDAIIHEIVELTKE